HLAYDRLDVLVVDLHTLKAINLLDFIYKIFLNGGRAFDEQDIRRRDASIRQRLTRFYKVVVLNQNVLGQRHQIALLHAVARFDEDLAITALDSTVRHHTVDLAHNRRVGRVPRFEQFRNARKTTGDIARLTHR